MLPGGILSSSPVISSITGARSKVDNKLISYEDGGIDIGDSSHGLLYQEWVGTVENLRDIYFTAANGNRHRVYSGGYEITELSISFDQLMRPYAAFVEYGVSKMYWYDSSIPGPSIFILPSDARCPKLILDDKRPSQTSRSDILLFYLRGTSFYYRQQRDRFEIEYLLKAGVEGDLLTVGFNSSYRLQFKFGVKMTYDELLSTLSKGSPISSSQVTAPDSSTTPSSSDIWELERKD